jgi:hypothetical protein
MTSFRFSIGVLAVVSVLPHSLSAQSALPTSVASGSTGREKPTTYTFTAKSPGLLSVVLRGESQDLVLVVTDEDGQTLIGGESDSDIGGNVSSEQLAIGIGAAGSYRVMVESRGDSTNFKIGSTFLAFPDLAQTPDPDGSPRSARSIPAGKGLDETLNPGTGDAIDWFSFKATESGTVTAVTRGTDKGDLVLEAFDATNFRKASGRSDQDLQGNGSNESVSATVKAGQSVYFRVTTATRSAEAVPYRLTLGFIPE